ncbi:gigantea protein [Perilla frutescens var. frutescens]|nr:gigantea protein [Perilla frutescens var. frutescens]
MATSNERWIDSLQFSSLFRPPPQDAEQLNAQVTGYVEFIGQFTSEQFSDNLAKLIRSRYPSEENTLFDDVLASFVLHHPEHGRAVILPIISCIIDGFLEYDRSNPPFASFISLVCPKNKVYSDQLALACAEILRILTHYNRPIYNREQQVKEADTSASKSMDAVSSSYLPQLGKKLLRPLSPWITDILLEAPLCIRSDYFRWCAGVAVACAATELKPPSTASSDVSGKHPLLMTSTPRWAVANGAAVILSVCDEEVARYETATLTAAAVPAVLLPPTTTPKDEDPIVGLPALEPYARLFHRYYAIASPSVTQKLLLGLLEAPLPWSSYALEAAVQLVELLRAAEDYASGIRLPRNWMYLHFLRAIGVAMSMQGGITADAVAALLFRILSQPALLFPPPSQVNCIEFRSDHLESCLLAGAEQLRELPTAEATAQGIASMLCANGLEVEWRICMIWEAAYGLFPLSSSSIDLPEIKVARPLQPPMLSWNLYIPLLKVLEYLPRGSPSESCLMKIFVATIGAVLQRTFPPESSREQIEKKKNAVGPATRNLSVAELRTIVHSLFLGSCASVELASRLLFVALTVCVNHEASSTEEGECLEGANGKFRKLGNKQGPIAVFGSYVIAAVCALSCELHTYSLISKQSNQVDARAHCRAIDHTRRILAILEALLSSEPFPIGTAWSWSCSSNDIVATVMVAAHISDLFRRSRACMQALLLLMRRKWDKEIHSRASSIFNLIDIHHKTVASIVDRAKLLEAHLLHAPSSYFHGRKRKTHAGCFPIESGQTSSLLCENLPGSEALTKHENAESSEVEKHTMDKRAANFPIVASGMANFLTMDGHIGFDCTAEVLRSVLTGKQELCFLVVSLLWRTLIASPEIQLRAESTSAQQGWRKVVDALSNVVSASPAKAAIAVVLQADGELKPWIVKDDDLGQKTWIINQRIVKVITELMRNHENSESLINLASASDLLLRATDGILVDGEACTLPQLELLEATARAVQPVLEWGEPGLAVADGLSNLLKSRLPATVRCVSHPSAHVRALSTSVLHAVLRAGVVKGIIELKDAVEKCLAWEARSRLATGLPVQCVEATAEELGCTIFT